MSNGNSIISKNSLYELMEGLLNKQERFEDEQQAFSSGNKKDSIPFLLYTKQGELFKGKKAEGEDDWLDSPFFTVKNVNINSGCATLSVLEPVDIDGCRVEAAAEVFSLLHTNFCLTVNLNFFCAIQPLSANLIERPIPIIEPKCK